MIMEALQLVQSGRMSQYVTLALICVVHPEVEVVNPTAYVRPFMTQLYVVPLGSWPTRTRHSACWIPASAHV